MLHKIAVALVSLLILAMTLPAAAQEEEEEEREERLTERQVVRQISELLPPLGNFLREVQQDDQEEYEDVLDYAREILEEYRYFKEEMGKELADTFLEIQKLEIEIDEFVEQWHESEGDQARERLEKQIKEICTQLFDRRLKLETAELRRLEEEVQEFREELDTRRQERAELIQAMLSEYLEVDENDDDEGEDDDRDGGRDEEDEDDEGEDGEDDRDAEDRVGRFMDKANDIELVRLKPIDLSNEEVLAAAAWNFDRDVKPKLVTACFDCHSGDSSEGNLNIAELLGQQPLVRNLKRWRNIIAQLQNRSMPPADTTQPSDDDRRVMIAWFRNAIENFDYDSVRHPGYEPARRLTHEEYNNTIRDLFGMDLRPADRLPEDLSGTSGFDNSANTLFLHGTLFEKYVGLAEFTVDRALPATPSTLGQRRAYQHIFVAKPDDKTTADAAAERVLRRFLSYAYRSPATKEDIAAAMAQFKRQQGEGANFEQAIRGVLQSVLISPKFIMHFEKNADPTKAFAVDQFELANRLSYFLWASMPDQELFRAAKENRLASPEAISEQVLRMLQDNKADTLGTKFAAQWLGFQHLGKRIRADPIDNPWCTDSLMDAMKAESAMHFVSLLKENKTLHELVDSKTTYLNEELARFYRIDGVRGKQMRKVRVDSTERGGIFGQGSLLAVTSFPGRTSPVMRGKWILSDVLGTPPPPPPPNVSELDEELEDRDSLTRRQKMEMHRRNPNCYACHSQIDPLGFALENYDWFGRFRKRVEGRRVDAKGQLPDGTAFEGPAGLKRVILDKRLDDLLMQLTRKMLSYALGRQLEYYDEAVVREISAQVRDDGYRLQTMVLAIASSYPFRFKQLPPTAESNL